MDINKILNIVRQAGEMFADRNFDVSLKTSISDKVTSMDIKVEAFLKEKLMETVEGSGFLGEESQGHELENEFVWVVDPIDGTANFIRDLSTSSVSVALLKDGVASIGVVYNPYRDEMFYAQKGEGAFLNGQKIAVSNMPFDNSMLFTSFAPYDKKQAKVCMDIINEVYQDCDDLRRFGSAAIELCLLACGRGDLYFELRLCPWDYAAGALILCEAGGYVGIPNKDKITYDEPVMFVAANSKVNYDRLLGIVKKHLDN